MWWRRAGNRWRSRKRFRLDRELFWRNLRRMTAATVNRVMEQALALPKAKQRILLGRLWKKLEWGHQLPPSLDEIERRAESVRKGTAVTFSMEEVNQALDRRRATAIKRLQRPARPNREGPESRYNK